MPIILQTVTSDSMDHLDPTKKDDYRDLPRHGPNEYPLHIRESELYWIYIDEYFGIKRIKAWEASVFIREHNRDIIEENKNARW